MHEHSHHHAIDGVALPLLRNPVAQHPRPALPVETAYPGLAERLDPSAPEPVAAELQPAGPAVSVERTKRSLFFRRRRDEAERDAFIERLSRLE